MISDCSVRILVQLYRSSSPTQTLPLLGSDQQLVLSFHADLQNLYAAVVQHSDARRRKRKSSEEERPGAEDADVSPQGLFGFGVWKTSCGVSPLHNTTRSKRFLLPPFFCKCRLYVTVAEGVTTTETGEDKQQRQSEQEDAEKSKMADGAPTKQVR